MQGFFPETLDGWLRLLLTLGGLLLSLWGIAIGAIRRPLLNQINGVGRRVKELEKTDAVHTGKLEEQSRHEQTRIFQWQLISERLGKMEGSHENLQNQVNKGMSELGERLASMEGTLKYIARQVGGSKE